MAANKAYTYQDLVAAMLAVRDELGRPPVYEEFRQLRGRYRNIVDKSGGWAKVARRVYGAIEYKRVVSIARGGLSDEQCIAAVQQFYQSHGRLPYIRDFTTDPSLPGQATLRRVGGMNNLFRMAGLPMIVPGGSGKRKYMSAEEYDSYRRNDSLSTAPVSVIAARLKRQAEKLAVRDAGRLPKNKKGTTHGI